MDFVWEDPPVQRRKGRVDESELAMANAMVENPGKWLRAFNLEGGTASSRAATLVSSINRSERAAFRKRDGGKFEATSRSSGKRGAVYIRFVQFD